MNDPRDIPAREHPTAGGAPQGEQPSAAPERPQPWHEADEKPSAGKAPRGGGAPIGTHSLTGGGAAVGMPQKPDESPAAERSQPREEPPGPDKPDLLIEPRAGAGDLLGH